MGCLVCRETRHPNTGHSPGLSAQDAMSRFLSHTACLISPLSAVNETAIGMTAILT